MPGISIADDGHIGLGLQQHAQPGAHHGVVVGQ